jgi:1,4-alpha-glucan branching enzyme
MGWMNDTLRYMSKDPVHRKYEHGSLTFSMIYAFSENFILPLSHDEVVHGKGSLLAKMPGDLWQKVANLRLLYGYMYGHPGKKLLFMGSEIGQWREWNHDVSLTGTCSVAGPPGILQLARLTCSTPQPALHQVDFDWQGYEWLELHDWENSVVAFLRRAASPKTPSWCRSATIARHPASTTGFGVPAGGFTGEILNTDSDIYGGSNVNRRAWGMPSPTPADRSTFPLRLPPLGTIFLKVPTWLKEWRGGFPQGRASIPTWVPENEAFGTKPSRYHPQLDGPVSGDDPNAVGPRDVLAAVRDQFLGRKGRAVLVKFSVVHGHSPCSREGRTPRCHLP